MSSRRESRDSESKRDRSRFDRESRSASSLSSLHLSDLTIENADELLLKILLFDVGSDCFVLRFKID